MRTTFWPNRIRERQSGENCHTGLKFSLKRENSALSMKFVQNVLFRSCAARFGKSHFWGSKFWKSSHSPEILFKKWKQCGFHENCTKPSFQIIFGGQTFESRYTCLKFSSKPENSALSMKIVQNVLFRTCPARFGKIAFVSVTLAPILSKKGKQCAFHENCTKPSFQVMRSVFWPNRILERQSCQNRQTGLKFFSKRENSTLSMKIVQNALFRSCAARFGQIALVSVKVVKIVTLASNSLQKGKTVRFSWKLYKTLFSDHAQHVLPKSHFWASKFSKSSNWPEIVLETGKECTFHENCTKRSFEIMRTTFWPNRIRERQSGENCHTGLKFSSKRENSVLFMKIVQNALFRSCGARFGQIAF